MSERHFSIKQSRIGEYSILELDSLVSFDVAVLGKWMGQRVGGY